MRRAVGVAFQGDGRHGDDGRCGELLFEIDIFRLALGEAQAPAVIVDDDRDMVRIVERGRAAIEGRVVEIPFRRSELPDQLGEIVVYFS